MTGCLDDDTTLGLVEGRLAAAALDVAEAHLDECASCRDVIAQLAKVTAPPPQSLAPGQQLGKYVVGELLGEGAMGRVYAAHQRELDRKVAIKVLNDTGASDRLLGEAQAMARLDHPNVVGVYEVGTLDGGGVFAVMDLVDGDTLRGWAEQPRDWRTVVRVLVEIARGLAAVHAAGVIHRDIKPDNIIVGGDGRARLGDFGLARGAGGRVRAGRLVDSVSFEDTVDAAVAARAPAVAAIGSALRVASGTAVAGTPVYMALELLQGKPATPASDQFALGVTAYEVIAGKRPFSGTTWAELARAVEHGAPPPLREVPRWLDAAIRRCLAVTPEARFGSLTELADHLERRAQTHRRPLWLAGAAAAAVVASGATWMVTRGAGEPAAVEGPSCRLGGEAISPVWNPAARAQLAALGAPVLAAVDGWSSRWAAEHDATCEAARTATLAKTAARERCLTRQRDELAALLDRSRELVVDRTTSDRLLDALAALPPADCRTAEPSAADPLPIDPTRAGDAQAALRELPAIRAAIALGDPAPLLERSAASVEQARRSSHAPTLAEALFVRGEALRAADQLDAAALAARDAVAAAERGHDDQTAARAWLLRVGIAVDRRDLAAADDLAALADATVDRAGAPPRLAAQLLRLRGTVAYYRSRFADARALLGKARERFVALSGERSVDVAGIETLLGATARAAGELATAERHHRAALALDRALRGPDHFDLSRDLHNLAGVLRLEKDLDGADATYREALAIEVGKRGERSVQAGLTHNSLGLVELERRDLARARAELELALAILTERGHGDRAFAEGNLGLVDAATGDHAAALAHYERALAIYAATIGETTGAAIRIHLDRARSLAALGRRAQARASATRALDAAVLGNVAWIVDDARALLATLEPRASGRPTTGAPGPAPLPPAPDRPPRDVGTYGANPGRP